MMGSGGADAVAHRSLDARSLTTGCTALVAMLPKRLKGPIPGISAELTASVTGAITPQLMSISMA